MGGTVSFLFFSAVLRKLYGNAIADMTPGCYSELVKSMSEEILFPASAGAEAGDGNTVRGVHGTGKGKTAGDNKKFL